MISAILYELKRHKIEYVILLTGLLLIGGLYIVVWPDIVHIRFVSISLGVFYALWGILAHTKSKTITPAVVAEYAAISVLAVLILLLITW